MTPRTFIITALLLSLAGIGMAQQAVFNPANGHTYRLTPSIVDFNDARAAASAAGGLLVTINDPAENQFLVNSFASFFNAGGTAYIGYTDEITEGIFLWDSGETPAFTNWNINQPDDWQAVGGEDYAIILGNGFWNDNPIDSVSTGIIEIPIRTPGRILLSPGATLTRDLVMQTFSVTAIITGLETPEGFVLDDPLVDPLVGGQITINGNLIANTDSLSGTTFSATTVTLSTLGATETLSLVGIYAHDENVVEDGRKLGGAQAVLPMDRRTLTQIGAPAATLSGASSPTLNAINTSLSSTGSALSLVFEVPFSGDPVLEFLAFDYDPAPPAPEVNLVTDGAGSLVMGVIATGTQAELYNLFVPMPASAMPGGGAFFGLDLTPFVLEAAMQPLGVVPFHVLADANGAWFWGLPSGSIPPMTIDLVTVAVNAGQVTWQSPVQRVVF